MNGDFSAMFANARQSYDAATKTSVSGRELEARALYKAARQLEDCMRDWDAPGCAERLDEAIRFNQRLWTLFQTQIADPAHPLPLELRINVLRLSQFIDKRSFELLSHPERSKLKALIDLNRNIAEGLRVDTTKLQESAEASKVAAAA
jgi:flagellar biosynthesis activator protein FlaF